jgi:hypothetical protein
LQKIKKNSRKSYPAPTSLAFVNHQSSPSIIMQDTPPIVDNTSTVLSQASLSIKDGDKTEQQQQEQIIVYKRRFFVLLR